MNGSTASWVTSLLDDLVELAPALLRSRQVLPAVDWRHAQADQVERLVSRLSADGMTLPDWLAFDLVAAGHTLPISRTPELAADIRALSGLNRPDVMVDEALELARRLQYAGSMERLPARNCQQVVDRLNGLGLTEMAIKLALEAYIASPEALRSVRPLFDSYVSQLPSTRLRVAGTSSTQAFVAPLGYAFAAHGFRASVADGGYNSVMIELVESQPPTDALILLLDLSFFMPQDWRRDDEQIRADLEERLTSLTQAMSHFCSRSGASLVVNTLPPSTTPSAGFADAASHAGSTYVCARVNQALTTAATATPQMFLIDAAQSLAALSGSARHEPKLWYYGRFAYSELAMRQIAWSVARLWKLRAKGPAKVLALDFDNTLWGGLYGDDGLDNLQCGDDFPGSAYKAFQNECLRLKSQGMILIGLSKNNSDAVEVFEKHPGVVLRHDDFVATSVDWNSKAANLQRIAGELGLGLDAFLFLDDSPHEREEMRRLCPEVIVPEMPLDPAMRPEWLRSLPATWPVRITEADAQRSQYYAAEMKSQQLRATSDSYEGYLLGLAQRLSVQPMTPATLPRIAQLHQRTNQFNLTNARFSEAELCQSSDGHEPRLVYSGSVQDRFGDLGLVITCAIDIQNDTAVIRSLVMSCRVIGRQFEQAFLSAILRQLKKKQIRNVVGMFKATAKNAVAAHVYSEFGFEPAETIDGFETWQLQLSTWNTEPSNAVKTIWSGSKC